MKPRRLLAIIFIISLLLGSSALAEDPTLATPSDLPCPHEHTEELIYFDNPAYARVDDETHRVYGVAVVDIRCTDCGEIISSETRRDAEQTRAHVYKNGVCALCGARQAAEPDTPEPTAPPAVVTPTPAPAAPATSTPATPQYEDLPNEQTLFLQPQDPDDTCLVLILTEQDFTDLEAQECTTVILRPEDGTAAIALPVSPLREELAAENSTLRAEIEQADSGAVFAALRLQNDNLSIDSDDDLPPDFSGSELIEIRFYQPADTVEPAPAAPTTVLYQPEKPDQSFIEQPATQVNPPLPAAPYYFTPWVGNGIYSPVTYNP